MSSEIVSDALKDLSHHSLKTSSLKYSKQGSPLKAPQSSPIRFRNLGQKTFHNLLCKYSPWEKLLACKTDYRVMTFIFTGWFCVFSIWLKMSYSL